METQTTLPEHYPLLLDEHVRVWEWSVKAGEHLDHKALSLVQAAGLILALVGALKLPGFTAIASPPAAIAALVIAFLAFTGLLASAFWAANPAKQPVPGTGENEPLFAKYLDANPKDAYLQILADYIGVTRRQMTINQHKAKLVAVGGGLFVLQIVALVSAALLA